MKKFLLCWGLLTLSFFILLVFGFSNSFAAEANSMSVIETMNANEESEATWRDLNEFASAVTQDGVHYSFTHKSEGTYELLLPIDTASLDIIFDQDYFDDSFYTNESDNWFGLYGNNAQLSFIVYNNGVKQVYTVYMYCALPNGEEYNPILTELSFVDDSNMALTGELSPAFDSNVFEYTYYYDESTSLIGVENIAFDDTLYHVSYIHENSTESKSGWEVAEQKGKIQVATKDNLTSNTYTINFERKSSEKNTLKSLIISNNNLMLDYLLFPSFNAQENNYKIIVHKETTTLHVSAVSSSLYSKINDATSSEMTHEFSHDITVSDNMTYELTVTSESGVANVYTITIEYDKDKNLDIEQLDFSCVDHDTHVSSSGAIVSHGEDPSIYTLYVSNKSDTISLKIKLKNEFQKLLYEGSEITTKVNDEYVIEDVSIPFGSSIVYFDVMAENGKTRTYTIVVNKDLETNLTQLKFNDLEDSVVYDTNVNDTPEKFAFGTKIQSKYDSLKMLLSLEGVEKYYIAVGSNELTDYQTSDGTLTYTLNNLAFGDNVIKIEYDTTVEGSPVRVIYSVILYRNHNDTGLSLTYNGKNIDSTSNEFALEVPLETNTVSIDSILDNNATILSTKISTSEVNLQKLNVEGKNNVSVDIVVQAEDTSITKSYKLVVSKTKTLDLISFDIMDASNNSKLTTITVDVEKFTYTYDVPSNSVKSIYLSNFNYKWAEIADSNKKGQESTIQLKTGINTISFNIWDKNGNLEQEEYQLYVMRPMSDENDLLTLKVLDNVIPRVDGKYFVGVPSTVNRIEEANVAITVSPDASHNSFKTLYLNYGVNNYEIFVTAQNGVIKSYPVVFYRAYDIIDILSSVGTISSSFSPSVLEYDLILPNNAESFEITAETIQMFSDKVSITGVGTYNVGDVSEVNIVVENLYPGYPATKTYKLNVKKESDFNTNLEKIEVENFTINPEFSSDQLNYIVKVDETTSSVNVKIFKGYDSQIVEIKTKSSEYLVTSSVDNVIENLSNGSNVVNVKVTSNNGESKVYTITIIKPYSDDKLWEIIKKDEASFDMSNKLFVANVGSDLTSSEFKKLFKNDYEDLFLLDVDGAVEEITFVESGMILQYVVDGNIRDQKTVVIVEIDPLSFKLESDIWTIDFSSVSNVSNDTSVEDLINGFKNSENVIVVNPDGTTPFVGEELYNGLVIKYVYNDKVYDYKTLIVNPIENVPTNNGVWIIIALIIAVVLVVVFIILLIAKLLTRKSKKQN